MPRVIEETTKYFLHEFVAGDGPIVYPWEMKDGDIGVMTEMGREGTLVMRQYDHIFSLNKLRATWDIGGDRPSIRVKLLQPGDAITILMK